ncbi:MAG: TonB-dependent receptor [Steroidobacteraceae bacterium]
MQTFRTKSCRPLGLSRTPVAAAVMLALASPALLAQDTTTLGEVIVTAQKRTENLQDVPISMEALNTEALEKLNVQSFSDYVRMLPTVTSAPSVGGGAAAGGGGFNLVYMRGIATGGDGQATTSQPSVGMYLDEQPITTVQGSLEIHLYDIARVEALAGPQGTLYGASSQAGTIRIITNKPDPSGFDAGYSLEGSFVDSDDTGYVAEGFVNLPIGEQAAIRLVGWYASEAGWIDNIQGTRLYPGVLDDPTDDIVADNSEFAKDNYNTLDTYGARAALRVNLGDNWTVMPQLQIQSTDQKGVWGDDLSDFTPGNDAVTHFVPEYSYDDWYQAGLTIEGRIGNLDVLYSGNYLEREVDASWDYADYAYWYDTAYTTGYFAGLFVDNDGNRLNPVAKYVNNDEYEKTSHELRISTPQDRRVRGLLGFFWQKQFHDFVQPFGLIEGLADVMLMNSDEPGGNQYPGIVYLNDMERTDRDQAIFGEISFDLTDQFELTLGARYFEPEVSVKGFFGFGQGFTDIAGWSGNGEANCFTQEDFGSAPCQNVDKRIKESDHIGRVNLSWRPTDATMYYATWSEGYRPGGINRNPFAGDYTSDFLTNYELGWKTRLLGDRLQFNGAAFFEDWEDFQVAFQGANGITQVQNGPTAEVQGVEAQLDWLATDRLRLAAGLAYYDTELQDEYCPGCNDDGSPWAPAGTELPITADFKGNLVARYEMPMGAFESHFQGALTYEGGRTSDLNVADAAVRGDMPSNTFLDLSFGVRKDTYAIELFLKNATDEDAPLYLISQCATGTCGSQIYGLRARPRTIGIKFTQEF